MTLINRDKIKRSKVLLIFAGFIVTGSILLLFLQDLQYNSDQHTQQIGTDQTTGNDILEDIVPTTFPSIVEESEDITISGWIPTWASASGLKSVQNNPTLFDSISPVWYEVNADGSLRSKFPSNRTQLLSELESKEIETIPTVALFDHELLSKILQSDENTERHIDSIVNAVLVNKFRGIDLDYESIKLSDKADYLEFIRDLSKELHNNDKILIVTVLAKWGEGITYSYKPETRQVQDWTILSKYADQVRIMAYDFTHSSDDFPGPIGPTSWIEQLLEYAKSTMPPEKTILGIHLYAYEWYQLPDSGNELNIMPDPDSNPNSAGNTAKAYTYQNVKDILGKYQGELSTFQDEGVFFYSRINNQDNVSERRALVFIDDNGVKARYNLAQEYGINGIVFWRLGEEGDIYKQIIDSK